MVSKQKANPLSQLKIGTRICRDMIIGLIVSVIICIFFTKLYTAISVTIISLGGRMPDFNYQDIFFTELSIAFLVISFVTLLANKTEDVYWVDVIQYRLVKPDHTSIVDISSYIFANMLVSLFSYLVPTKWDFLLFSFVQIIFLLGMLSLKLLMAFFGIEDLKCELEEEYEMSLDFRKTIVSIYHFEPSHDIIYYRDYLRPRFVENMNSSKGISKYLWKVSIFRIFFTDYLRFVVKDFFKDPRFEKYEEISSKDFNEDAYLENRDGSIEHLYKNIISGVNRPSITNFCLLKLYIKLLRYSIKFDGNVYAHTEMMDSLYTNTINAIEQKSIQKSCEQIFFMFKFKEYQRALSCMMHALDCCPPIYIRTFSYLQKLDISDRECLKICDGLIGNLRSIPEYKLYKNSDIMKPVFSFLSKNSARFLTKTSLDNQFNQALQAADYLSLEYIYRTHAIRELSHSIDIALMLALMSHEEYRQYQKSIKESSSKKVRIPPALYEKANEYFKDYVDSWDKRAQKSIDQDWFESAFSANDANAIYALLVAYSEWLNYCFSDFEFDTYIQHMDDPIREAIVRYLSSACNINIIFEGIMQKYREGNISEEHLIKSMLIIGKCRTAIADLSQKYIAPDFRRYFDKQLVPDLAAALNETGIKIHLHSLTEREIEFWLFVFDTQKEILE